MIIELRFWYQTVFKSGYATHCQALRCSEPWLPRLADGEAECWWILVASACPASLPSFVHNFLLGSVPLSFSVHMGTCSRTDW